MNAANQPNDSKPPKTMTDVNKKAEEAKKEKDKTDKQGPAPNDYSKGKTMHN